MPDSRRNILMALSAALLLTPLAGAKDLTPTLHPKAQPLPFNHQGPFVTTGDGGVLCVDARSAWRSRDEGRTWTTTRVFRDEKKYRISNERALLRTRDGVVISAWMNMAELKTPRDWRWGEQDSDWRDFVLPIYVCRSLDEGKSWEEPIFLNKPWCGCIHSLIETSAGRIVLVGQEIIPAWRHATVLFVSDDKGLTWRRSNVLDIGQGRHDHAGSIEGTVVELRDGTLYQLLRNETGRLYQAVSSDGGLLWKDLKPTSIRSVTCCAQMGRLASGGSPCSGTIRRATVPPAGPAARNSRSPSRPTSASPGRRRRSSRPRTGPAAGCPIPISTNVSPESCGLPPCKAVCV